MTFFKDAHLQMKNSKTFSEIMLMGCPSVKLPESPKSAPVTPILAPKSNILKANNTACEKPNFIEIILSPIITVSPSLVHFHFYVSKYRKTFTFPRLACVGLFISVHRLRFSQTKSKNYQFKKLCFAATKHN